MNACPDKDCPYCGNHVFPVPAGYFCNECGAELSQNDVIETKEEKCQTAQK